MVTGSKKKTVSQLKKKADAVFSEYIRRRSAESELAICVTCGATKPWKELQAGHYEKRGINALRYDERNVHPQCVGCNVFQNGNYPRYATFMVQSYGQSILSELEAEAKQIKQWKTYELQEIIDRYQGKIAALDS